MVDEAVLEQDGPFHGYTEIATEVESACRGLADTKHIDAIWLVDTSAWEPDGYVEFTPLWPESERGYSV